MHARTMTIHYLYGQWSAPSFTGLMNLFDIQEAANGPVSASPSPTTAATIRSGLSKTAPVAWEIEYPNSPPSWIEPGVSGAAWEATPPGNEKRLKSFFIPATSCVISGKSSVYAYWRAANYVSVGQLYLKDNPLLRRPLEASDVKVKPIKNKICGTNAYNKGFLLEISFCSWSLITSISREIINSLTHYYVAHLKHLT